MKQLFGQSISEKELNRKIGALTQVAGIRRVRLEEGRAHRVSVAEVYTGSGLRYDVILDRGMDISRAEFKGIPLSWRSTNGDVHPSYYDPLTDGWIRSFAGGLMCGCGMSNVGAWCSEEDEHFGLHGRLSHSPAYDVVTNTEYREDEIVFSVSGSISEVSPFRYNLRLRRRIGSALGGSVIYLVDSITNLGDSATPLMMLYHINLGWPVIGAGSRLWMNEKVSIPRDAEAEKGLERFREFSEPAAGYREQVFYHTLAADEQNTACVIVENLELDLAVAIEYRVHELPNFVQWKMLRNGLYVLGLEPANCRVEGRVAERARGTLRFLESGASEEFRISIAVIEGRDSIRQQKEKYSLR